MSEYTGILWIVVILGIVLMMGILKSKADWIVNFLLRGIMGMLGIYFVNMLPAVTERGGAMGYNILTFVIGGTLGLPGIALMYGINFYMML